MANSSLSKLTSLPIYNLHISLSQYGALFLSVCDVMLGSPTALADRTLESRLVSASSSSSGHGLYVPAGAFWGGEDIRKMAERGTLKVGMGYLL